MIGRCDFPWTVAIALIATVATACAMNGADLTGPFVHTTWGHLVRDLSLVLLAGIAYEQPLGAGPGKPGTDSVASSSTARWPMLLLAGIVVPAAAVRLGTDAVAYYGLSGLSHALLAAALGFELRRQRGRRRVYVAVLVVLGAAKIGYELVTGEPAFPMELGAGVRAVPLAHAAGAIVGLCFRVCFTARRRAPAEGYAAAPWARTAWPGTSRRDRTRRQRAARSPR